MSRRIADVCSRATCGRMIGKISELLLRTTIPVREAAREMLASIHTLRQFRRAIDASIIFNLFLNMHWLQYSENNSQRDSGQVARRYLRSYVRLYTAIYRVSTCDVGFIGVHNADANRFETVLERLECVLTLTPLKARLYLLTQVLFIKHGSII